MKQFLKQSYKLHLLFVGVCGILLSLQTQAAPDGAAIVVPLEEIERARKRLYPGGRDEEDLKVQANLPEAMRKTDERSIQKEVYKAVFNQEMKDQAEQPVDEPIGESEDGQ